MDQASQVREKIDVVSLISEFIPLKKAGRNFTAVCPFHNENTPSFVVSPERQIWHCFGCGKGGDAFTFLMEYENLEFIEALRILAKKVGITLKAAGDSQFSSKKEEIYRINSLASEYYNFVLTNHPIGKKALEYLIKERGLNEKLIKTFNIGFAPSGGRDLSNYLMTKKKYQRQQLVDAGISVAKGMNVYDFFRDRIMFPLIDHRGNTVGFSGRNLTNSDFGPKYINTRDTLVYHKGSMFFGLNQAKEDIKKEGFSIVMEGEFDIISAYKEGITNAVALKGTALTEPQAMLLSRFAPKVALCLDQDEAGYTAIKRSIPQLEKRGLLITVIVPEGKDPDEAIKKNAVAFKKAIKNDIEVYDYLIQNLLKVFDPSSALGKKKISDEILPLISVIQNEILKEHYLKKLAQEIDISFETLQKQLERKESGSDDGVKTFKSQASNRKETLERYLLSLIIQNIEPKEALEKSKDILSSYKFDIPSIGKIIAELILYFSKRVEFNVKEFSKKLPPELISEFDKSFLAPLPKFDDAIKYEDEIIRVSKDLKILHLKNRIKEIGKELKSERSEYEIQKLQEEISLITQQLAA